MVVRIRLHTGRPVQRRRGKNRHLALAGGALLIPVSLMAYVLGFWGLASEMGIAGGSGIQGVFSHWQLWIAAAVALNLASSVLNRYGRGGEMEVPSVLTPRFLRLRGSVERPHSKPLPRSTPKELLSKTYR
ncbi:MAG TPA: hypothetical protein VKV74_10200 [Bryobacteraceae bacterium]|nr:hypothetical protein [Bryobacteraceae bacterium]